MTTHLKEEEEGARVFLQDLIELLQVCMAIHSGHPEIYMEMQERMGELVYDSGDQLRMMSEEEVERAKLRGMWTARPEEQELI